MPVAFRCPSSSREPTCTTSGWSKKYSTTCAFADLGDRDVLITSASIKGMITRTCAANSQRVEFNLTFVAVEKSNDVAVEGIVPVGGSSKEPTPGTIDSERS